MAGRDKKVGDIFTVLQDIIEHPKYKIITKYLPTVSQKPSKNNLIEQFFMSLCVIGALCVIS